MNVWGIITFLSKKGDVSASCLSNSGTSVTVSRPTQWSAVLVAFIDCSEIHTPDESVVAGVPAYSWGETRGGEQLQLRAKSAILNQYDKKPSSVADKYCSQDSVTDT